MTHAASLQYHHRTKDASPGTALRMGAVTLKWYDLDETANRITQQTRTRAQTALHSFAAFMTDDCAGFAILHQCSASYAFLLISTWRGNNELWQSVQYIDHPLTAFAPFGPAYSDAPNLRPTFCVWELGIVAHEASAWQHYLNSERAHPDFDHWQSNCYHGKV